MPTQTESIVLVSEIFLSLYPILLKNVDVSLLTQVLFRMGTYTTLGSLGAGDSDWEQTWGSFDAIKTTALSGLMTLVHVGSSYASYKYLSAGSALALFYTYPFINVLAGILFLGEEVVWKIVPLMVVAFIGVLLIAYSENDHQREKENFQGDIINNNTLLGITFALIAALTETIIFLIVKTSVRKNPFVNIIQLYSIGFLALAGYAGFNGFKDVRANMTQLAQIVGFNAFIGFIGYSLRFYTIPRLSTLVFSLMTFVGVASGYLWGLLFAGEKPGWMSILGALCITGSVGVFELLK